MFDFKPNTLISELKYHLRKKEINTNLYDFTGSQNHESVSLNNQDQLSILDLPYILLKSYRTSD